MSLRAVLSALLSLILRLYPLRALLLLVPNILLPPQVNNHTSQYQDSQHTYAYRNHKYPYKAFVLPGPKIFKVSVAGGKGLTHLKDAVGLADGALV